MSTTTSAITTLKKSGHRTTLVRRALLDVLGATDQPLSSDELHRRLAHKNIAINKTTVYRQLETLLGHELVTEVRLNDRTARYELNRSDDHHHHLVCLGCDKIDDISFQEDVERQERTIAATKKFKVLRHTMEFFGLCRECQKKKKFLTL